MRKWTRALQIGLVAVLLGYVSQQAYEMYQGWRTWDHILSENPEGLRQGLLQAQAEGKLRYQ